ncbi:ciliogenesis-associated TTC17-interacting protein [Erinaceus europaeus]|uniref:Ciliogenesis-associated TTC17-interacting protein n=1 Tax=Erinaceus europaeus TaxID=9365 RepID=A0ABM3XM35_ERIEU|nr:ciliogenesis-associated TTC17-interacting protein [Erinaceus europaeus]
MFPKSGASASKAKAHHPAAKHHHHSGQKVRIPPHANAEAITFLRSLQLEELQKAVFSETLTMFSDIGEPQGELTIDVQRSRCSDEVGILTYCLFVHAFSRSVVDQVLCANTVQGNLSAQLEVIEQHSQEFIKFQTIPMERKVDLLKRDNQLTMTRYMKEDEDIKVEVTTFPCDTIAGFVSETANLVLLRVMAWRQTVPRNARFLALDTDGRLSYSTYQALGSQTIQVDHHEAEVFIVEQTVHSEDGIPVSCQFYLLPDGHLAKRVQVGSPGCCVLTTLPALREEDEMESRPVFEKKPLKWEEDVEFYSKFLDRKEELRLSHSSYKRQHPEAQALMSDFLLFLLLRQPADVVTFAAEFFGPFAQRHPPTPSLRSSHRPSPFRPLEPEPEPEPEPKPESDPPSG